MYKYMYRNVPILHLYMSYFMYMYFQWFHFHCINTFIKQSLEHVHVLVERIQNAMTVTVNYLVLRFNLVPVYY